MKKIGYVCALLLCTLAAGLCVVSCGGDDEPKTVVDINDLDFTVYNATNGCDAQAAGAVFTTTTNINVTVGGETVTISYTKQSNELVAQEGDKIIVNFLPKGSESVAVFTMPDGSVQEVDKKTTSFEWIVGKFENGAQIKGECRSENDTYIYNRRGTVKLVHYNN